MAGQVNPDTWEPKSKTEDFKHCHPLGAPVRHWEEHSSVVGTKMETSYHANSLAKEWRQQGLLMFKEPTMSMTVCLGTSNVISLHDEIKI